MNDVAEQCAQDLFSCFQIPDTIKLYPEKLPDWIEVDENSVKAYCNDLIIYEYDRHKSKGISFFNSYQVNESKLAWATAMASLYFYDMHGHEIIHFVEHLNELGIIWTT